MRFASSLDPGNEVLKLKLSVFNSTQEPDRLLPTTLIEERNSNPFLSLLKFKSLFGSADRLKCFGLLLKLRDQFGSRLG